VSQHFAHLHPFVARFGSSTLTRQRGDGFPLANMLALISVEAKDFVPLMTAHIFTVCPTAIPTLPLVDDGAASEDALMESLGMLRVKDTGEFESFERFLSRTEVGLFLVP
jgi:GLE1-like protein